jgi:hypothetical protein
VEQPEIAALIVVKARSKDRSLRHFLQGIRTSVGAAEGCDLLLSGAPLLCSHTLNQSFWIRFLALYDFSS